MVNIAIIDKNEIFSDSLQMILEKVADFNVKVYPTSNDFSRYNFEVVPDVLLLDAGFGKEKSKQISETVFGKKWPKKTIMMVMFYDELYLDFYKSPLILKSSCIKEFENRIRELANLEMPERKHRSSERNYD